MAAKQQEITYEEIVRRVRAKDFCPVYYLMGEEPYYIDKISDYIVDTVLTPVSYTHLTLPTILRV